jgi:hypothetical protein
MVLIDNVSTMVSIETPLAFLALTEPAFASLIPIEAPLTVPPAPGGVSLLIYRSSRVQWHREATARCAEQASRARLSSFPCERHRSPSPRILLGHNFGHVMLSLWLRPGDGFQVVSDC